MIYFDTSQLGHEPLELTGEEPGELLDLARDPIAREDGPIRYDLVLDAAGEDLIVTGAVEAPLKLRCARCAQFFSTTVRVSSFLHAYELAEHPVKLDVSTDVREDLLLEIPGFPLCEASCKGLCAQCGQNWNAAACGCAPVEDVLSPWEALTHLKVDAKPDA